MPVVRSDAPTSRASMDAVRPHWTAAVQRVGRPLAGRARRAPPQVRAATALYERARLDPAPNRLRAVCGGRVEANLGARRVLVHEVEQLLEQQELRRRAKPSADQHAVEAALTERRRGHGFCGGPGIDQGTHHGGAPGTAPAERA